MKTTTQKSSANGSNGKSQNSKSTETNSGSNHSTSSQLEKLFEDELKDIYWAEKALTKAIPKMIKNATSQELIDALQNHLGETEEQISRLEQVFELVGKKAVAKKCEAMAGLLKEGEEIMEATEEGAMRDAGIILAGQKVEHYEIATYGTLRTFASIMGMNEAADLLETTLNEEKAVDEKLTEVAEAAINLEAAETEE